MLNDVLARRFAQIRAQLVVEDGPTAINVENDRRFMIRYPWDTAEVEVIDVAPSDRHLLLLVREGRGKSKFLCGHDERHWFVAAVPEGALGVTGVMTAKRALQPWPVQDAVGRALLKDAFRRRNRAYVRQGEWFFVPAPEFDPPPLQALNNEPLTRGRGKAHIMQFAHRRGGEVVLVERYSRRLLTQAQFAELPERERRRSWSHSVHNPEVFAKGTVRHPDHATIHLNGWHRVLLNTEQQAQAMRHVTFLD